MRASSAIKLVSAWCGGLLLSMPVNALKKIYDYREGDDYKSKNKNCGELLAISCAGDAAYNTFFPFPSQYEYDYMAHCPWYVLSLCSLLTVDTPTLFIVRSSPSLVLRVFFGQNMP